eukprot:TRINITY_DN103746_c0_g1_i1.p1 TRINITY_DN103746_c0_g1~~TRINITY_DN103746_c0_g1_i1.p1  ORF type:complete len:199 (+),score=48.19 TRINITY_DN103746_c0_g1_i1:191-787(+)
MLTVPGAAAGRGSGRGSGRGGAEGARTPKASSAKTPSSRSSPKTPSAKGSSASSAYTGGLTPNPGAAMPMFPGLPMPGGLPSGGLGAFPPGFPGMDAPQPVCSAHMAGQMAPVLKAQLEKLSVRIQKLERSRGSINKEMSDMMAEAKKMNRLMDAQLAMRREAEELADSSSDASPVSLALGRDDDDAKETGEAKALAE